MKACSEDLRQPIVQAVNDGASQPVVADRYNVSLNSAKRYVKQWCITGSLATQTRPGRPRAFPPVDQATFVTQFAADPDASLAIYCARWEACTGVRVGESPMYRAQQRVGWTRKKSLIATERDDAVPAAFRTMSALWEASALIFLDESGAQTNMTPHDSRAPCGERAYGWG
jgi:transposase